MRAEEDGPELRAALPVPRQSRPSPFSPEGARVTRRPNLESKLAAWLAGTAAALAAAALVETSRRKAEREHPPTGEFITIDGVRLHVHERGRGDPLVLLHGNAVPARIS